MKIVLKGLQAIAGKPKLTKRQQSVSKKVDAANKKYNLGKYEDPTMKAIERGSAYGIGGAIGVSGFKDLKRKMQNVERKEIK